MKFNSHYNLVGKHAFLSASKYHWLNYDDEKLDEVFRNHTAAQRGTELHELAFNLIRLKVRLARSNKTLNMYVNDCIGLKLTPELLLYYSDNSFGTADALGLKGRRLQIFDLKNGVKVASEKQLWIYAALFCLEYGFSASDLEYDLRIYQNDEVVEYTPTSDVISHVMARIIYADKRLTQLRLEAE